MSEEWKDFAGFLLVHEFSVKIWRVSNEVLTLIIKAYCMTNLTGLLASYLDCFWIWSFDLHNSCLIWIFFFCILKCVEIFCSVPKISINIGNVACQFIRKDRHVFVWSACLWNGQWLCGLLDLAPFEAYQYTKLSHK